MFYVKIISPLLVFFILSGCVNLSQSQLQLLQKGNPERARYVDLVSQELAGSISLPRPDFIDDYEIRAMGACGTKVLSCAVSSRKYPINSIHYTCDEACEYYKVGDLYAQAEVKSLYDEIFIKSKLIKEQQRAQRYQALKEIRERETFNKAQLEICVSSKKNKLWNKARDIVFSRKKIKYHQDLMESERKQSEISGYINGELLREAAIIVINEERALKNAEAQYIEVGGDLRQVESISNEKYPCEAYESDDQKRVRAFADEIRKNTY